MSADQADVFYEPGVTAHGLPHDPFKACVVPRPIGWISTLNVDGSSNLCAAFLLLCFRSLTHSAQCAVQSVQQSDLRPALRDVCVTILGNRTPALTGPSFRQPKTKRLGTQRYHSEYGARGRVLLESGCVLLRISPQCATECSQIQPPGISETR